MLNALRLTPPNDREAESEERQEGGASSGSGEKKSQEPAPFRESPPCAIPCSWVINRRRPRRLKRSAVCLEIMGHSVPSC